MGALRSNNYGRLGKMNKEDLKFKHSFYTFV